MENKISTRFGIACLIVLLMASFVSSFAVGSKYWEEKPILVSPGETVDFFLVLQNLAGEGGDLMVEGTIIEGGEIAKFTDDSIKNLVPFGTKMNINLSATIPENAQINSTINVVVSFKIIDENKGQFGFGSSVERVVPVRVVEGVKQNTLGGSNLIYVIVGLIILVLAIIIYVVRKKKVGNI